MDKTTAAQRMAHARSFKGKKPRTFDDPAPLKAEGTSVDHAVGSSPVKAQRSAVKPAAMINKMKARPNWSENSSGGADDVSAFKLNIPQDVVEALARDGIALQWITRSVRGMEAPREVSKFCNETSGWTPVHQSDFEGVLDGLFMPKGADEVITYDDCMLVARPMYLQQKSQQVQFREARRPVQVTEQAIGHGIPGVTGSDHVTALRGNQIKKTVVNIPD
jgi:hypothetical protein